MDGWQSRLPGQLGQNLDVLEVGDIRKSALFDLLPSAFVLASLASSLVSSEPLLAVTFALAIGVSLSSALLFISLSSLLLLLNALLSFLPLLLEFLRGVFVPFLFVLFVLQTLLSMFLSSARLRPSSLLDIIRRFLLRSAFFVRAFLMSFLFVASFSRFFRLRL